MNKFKDRIFWVVILILLGLLTTVKLAWIYFDANFNPYALASFCSVNDFIDCDGIAKTTHSQFLGVPLALWGIALYSFMLVLVFSDKLKKIKLFGFLEVFKNPFDYIASLGLISFVISMTLLGVSIFEIEKLCILCALTYVLNLVIALLAVDFKDGGFIKSFRQSVADFIDALKIKKYLAAFIAAALIAGAGLAYTRLTYKLAPQVKKLRGMGEFIEAKHNKYKVSGNILGAKNPEVVVNIYSDYQCPVCYAHNIMMHKLAREFRNVQVVHHNLPLDMSCNVFITKPFHTGSCIDAKYELAAEKQGKAWDMNDLLFQHKPQTEDEILALAKDLRLNIEQLKADANSGEIEEKLQLDIHAAAKKGLLGTPVTEIGGTAQMGIKPYKEFKELLVKEGAK